MRRQNYEQIKFFTLFCFLSFILFLSPLNAQDKGEIRGRVTNAVTGEELIGANVFIPGLNIGASTDVNGYFSIKNVTTGTQTLTAQYVGFEKMSYDVVVRANTITEQNFSMNPTSVQMDEVVVTGQGTAIEKKKLTTSVETINLEEIRNAPVETVDQLLQGRIAGLNSFTSSGLPGTSGRVTTRGVKSSITNTTPVIYVDGIRVDNADAYRLAIDLGGTESTSLSDLVVGEIDHIEVIKGGAGATIYGSEAANGIIQIFTKKGIPGEPRWTANITGGYDKPEEQFISEELTKKYIMHTGRYQSYSLGVQGGSKDFTYNVNGKVTENLGLIVHDKAKNQSYNLATGFRVILSEKTNVEGSISYVKSQLSSIFNNNTINAPFAEMEFGSYKWWVDDYGDSLTEAGIVNRIENYMLAPEITDDVDRFRVALNFEYKPFENFTNKITFGTDYRNNEQRAFIPKFAGDYFGAENGSLQRFSREYATYTLGYNASYILPKLGPLEQTLSFGAQGFRVEDRQTNMYGETFDIPGTDDIGNAADPTLDEDNRQLFNGGFYLTDQIGLWDKVFIDAGFRVDGNSTFGDAIGMQFYPKVGIAYNISDENYYPQSIKPYISTFKVRSSWGQTGNFPTPFTRDKIYGAQQFLGNVGIVFEPLGNPGNDELAPERTTSIDAGFDMGLFQDKALLEFNYFYQITKDALFQFPRDPASGWGLQLTNVGEIVNQGMEWALNAQLIQIPNFAANMRISYSTLDNEVTDLGGAAPFDLPSFTFLPRRMEEGHPVGVFRVNEPIKDENGNYTGEYEEKLVGTPMPTDFGSVSLNITLFKDFTLSGLLEYAFGHDMVNLKKVLRYFNGTDDAKDLVPDGYNFQTASSIWLEKADWIKLREISLTYRIPDVIINYFGGTISSASINFSARNVAVFGVDSNNDPESNGYQPGGPATGGYAFADPSAPRQFRFGITLNF
ncbi:MAG: TonB-dependent receptor [Ignavibacteriales bacterium]|nr:TonB-dependent receptor [Ignavibacteriales bacterium]